MKKRRRATKVRKSWLKVATFSIFIIFSSANHNFTHVSASKKEVTNTTTISWSTKEIASLLAEIALQSLTSVTIDWNTVAATVGGDKDSDKCRSKWFEIKKEENEKRGKFKFVMIVLLLELIHPTF